MQPWQQAALPYLDKLFDPMGNRQTGRTYLLAVALIRAACRNPTIEVPFIDHHDNDRRSLGIVKRYVQILVKYSPELKPYYKSSGHHFRLNLPEPIMDWMPDGPIDEDAPSFWEKLMSD